MSTPQQPVHREDAATSASGLLFYPSKEEVWSANFEKIKEFYHTHGHLTLPRDNPESARLSQWLTYQRHHSKTLRKDQVEKLESINYKNTPVRRPGDDIDWEAKFNRVKEQHDGGDSINDRALACWLSRQKRKMRNNLLDPKRKEKLHSIGIGSTPLKKVVRQNKSEQWNSNYEKLKEYHSLHGDSNVPRNWKVDRSLGMWVSNQRRQFVTGSMSSERAEKLAQLQFEWKRPLGRKKS